MNLFTSTFIVIGLVTLICYKYKMFGTYRSLPYRSSVYIEPSNITKKFAHDNNMGVSLGKYYVALYINNNNNSNESKYSSKVFYCATPNTIDRLQKEAYYNDPSKY